MTSLKPNLLDGRRQRRDICIARCPACTCCARTSRRLRRPIADPSAPRCRTWRRGTIREPGTAAAIRGWLQKGWRLLVRTGAARLPASKPRASLRVSVMCRAKLVFMRRRGIVRRGIVRIHALQRVLKAANALGQTLSELRQLLRAEEQQGDGQDDQQVPGLEQIFN